MSKYLQTNEREYLLNTFGNTIIETIDGSILEFIAPTDFKNNDSNMWVVSIDGLVQTKAERNIKQNKKLPFSYNVKDDDLLISSGNWEEVIFRNIGPKEMFLRANGTTDSTLLPYNVKVTIDKNEIRITFFDIGGTVDKTQEENS